MNKGLRTIVSVVLSLVVISAAGWWFYTEYTDVSRTAHETKRQTTITFVQSHADPFIATGELTNPDPNIQRGAYEKFFASVQSPELFRIKVWNREYVVVWSDLPEIIGVQYSDNEEVRRAFEGDAVLSIGQPKLEHISERQLVQILEVYVPVRDASGNIITVIETYTVGDDIASEVANTLWMDALLALILAVLGVGIVLWGVRRFVK